MYSKVTKDGITLVCTKLYFNDKNMIKVEVATAQGKKLHDKREDLKENLLKMLNHNGPYLLEVMVAKEENVFPMMTTGASVSEVRLN
jgi:thiamine pyrophosphate-dependent acetolactate synthase large subunit-like protein